MACCFMMSFFQAHLTWKSSSMRGTVNIVVRNIQLLQCNENNCSSNGSESISSNKYENSNNNSSNNSNKNTIAATAATTTTTQQGGGRTRFLYGRRWFAVYIAHTCCLFLFVACASQEVSLLRLRILVVLGKNRFNREAYGEPKAVHLSHQDSNHHHPERLSPSSL